MYSNNQVMVNVEGGGTATMSPTMAKALGLNPVEGTQLVTMIPARIAGAEGRYVLMFDTHAYALSFTDAKRAIEDSGCLWVWWNDLTADQQTLARTVSPEAWC